MAIAMGLRGPVLMSAAIGALIALGVAAFLISPSYIERLGWWWIFPLVALVGAAVGLIVYRLRTSR